MSKMSLYAMSDLHLSHFKEKPMDIFDEIWHNHTEKILKNWNEIVSCDDTVIVNGDLSWGMAMEEAKLDLDFISALNGNKIIVQGNHDYYWNSTSKLNDMYSNMFFIKNNYAVYEDYAICGTKGWICPNDTRYTDHDNKIYKREAGRLKFSLDMAIKNGYNESNIIVATHFPPTNDSQENSLFTDILKSYNIKRVIYGHLHGANKYNNSLLGNINGIEYSLVSADYLNFKPIKIL